MESTSATTISSSTKSLETLLPVSDKAKALGLIIKYGAIKYRDQEVLFLSDPSGHECWAQWDGRLIDLGLDNIYYKEDMCRIIDRELDLITDFRNCPDFVGAKLEYFRNGDFRDIRLIYKGRTVKVFLVAGEVSETFLISESERILKTSGLLNDL
jgi:hypothetical protein